MNESISEDDLITVCGQVGKILLTSGAETSRVEGTVEYIGRAAHYDITCHATITALFVGVNNQTKTHLVKVRLGDFNLEKVDEINTMSRRFVEGKIDFAELKRPSIRSIKRSSISLGRKKYLAPPWFQSRQCFCSRQLGQTWDWPFLLASSATWQPHFPAHGLKRLTLLPDLVVLPLVCWQPFCSQWELLPVPATSSSVP